MAKGTRYAWQDKVVNSGQIGGIEVSTLDNGAGRGVRIAWVNTGTGLRYKVVIDRGMDIADAFFNEHSLAWLSHAGTIGARPDANRGLEWLYTFNGGLVATCGLSNMGAPDSDENEERGLHGRYGNLAAELVGVDQPDVVRGKLDFSISGIMRESKVFGPLLEMRRTISGRLGEAKIKIKDVVTNRGGAAKPLMLLYHCNYGYPLVDEGAEFIYKGKCVSRGMAMDDELFASKHDYKKCCKPLASHAAGKEACGIIDVTADSKGQCCIGVHNPKIGLALTMKYAKKQLPYVTNWQHWGVGEYVGALEPGTNPPYGQNKAREAKELIMLGAGKSKTFELELGVLDDAKAIKGFCG